MRRRRSRIVVRALVLGAEVGRRGCRRLALRTWATPRNAAPAVSVNSITSWKVTGLVATDDVPSQRGDSAVNAGPSANGTRKSRSVDTT